MAEEYKLCNLKMKSGKLKIDPSTIPDIVPKKILEQWMEGDTDPYYKIQEIEIPVKGTGGTYVKSFFESFLSKLKERPIPGNKAGHDMSYGKRAPTDFIVVGGKIETNKKGEGKVYFKNYIPKEGQSGSNEIFIRENKSDMIHYSLVSYVRQERIESPNGTEVNIIESMYGERNDAVEWGTGAMKQTTNREETITDDVSENQNKGGDLMPEPNKKAEVLQTIKVLKANADITLNEVAEAMGLKNKIVTEEHVSALETVKTLRKNIGSENIIDAVADMKKKIEDGKEVVRNATLDSLFGVNTDGKNELRFYMGDKTKGIEGEELKEEINSLKETDVIAKRLVAERADYTSNHNDIGRIDDENKDTDQKISRRVDEM